VDDLQKKAAEKKPDTPAPKDAAPAAKDGAK